MLWRLQRARAAERGVRRSAGSVPGSAIQFGRGIKTQLSIRRASVGSKVAPIQGGREGVERCTPSIVIQPSWDVGGR